MIVKSDKFKLVYLDIKKAAFNALIFGSPLLLIVLLELQAGKSFEEIRPLIIAWILQTSIDLVKKFISANKYQVK